MRFYGIASNFQPNGIVNHYLAQSFAIIKKGLRSRSVSGIGLARKEQKKIKSIVVFDFYCGL